MMVEGEISEREVAFCKMVAVELGFSHKIIGQMVRGIIEMVARGIAPEVALQRLVMRQRVKRPADSNTRFWPAWKRV